MDIRKNQIELILLEDLAVKEICSRCIQHDLSKAQKEIRVKEMLKKFNLGVSPNVYGIVAGNETYMRNS